MALSKTINVKGITVQNAYHRVQQVVVTKDTIVFNVSASASSTEDAFSCNAFSCSYDLDGSNAIKQAYEHLKTLPEFSNSTDV